MNASTPRTLLPFVLLSLLSAGCARDSRPLSPDETAQTSVTTLTTNGAQTVMETAQSVDEHADGSIDGRYLGTIRFDQFGNPVQGISEWDDPATPGIDSRSVTTTEYNIRGNMVRSTWEWDRDANGTVDLTATVVTIASDSHDNPVEQTVVYQGDVDIDGYFNYSLEYDTRGRPVRRISNDGFSATIITYGYDARDNLVSYEERDGFLGSFTGFSTMAREYSAHNALLNEVNTANGVVVSAWSTVAFDQGGNPVEQEFTAGTTERTIRFMEYDHLHRLLSQVEERVLADGSVDRRISTSFHYSGPGPVSHGASNQLIASLSASIAANPEAASSSRMAPGNRGIRRQ